MLMRWVGVIPVLVSFVSSVPPISAAARLVVSADDHSFDNSAFLEDPALLQYANDPLRFQLNVLDWLGGPTGRFLQYGDLRSLTDRFTYTVGTHLVVRTSDPNELARLSQYQGVIVGLEYKEVQQIPSSMLLDYILSGGGVYLYGGTNRDETGASTEAARWESFLRPFGIQFASEYTDVPYPIDTSGYSAVPPWGEDLFIGVRRLEFVNGQLLSVTSPTVSTQIFGGGLFVAAEIPEPGSWSLVAVGFILSAVRLQNIRKSRYDRMTKL